MPHFGIVVFLSQRNKKGRFPYFKIINYFEQTKGKQTMKTAFIISGIVITLLFGGIIAAEKDNSNFAEEHPFMTLLSGTPNKDVGVYTYTPPFTLHEVVMMMGVGAGIVLLAVGIKMALPKK